MHSGYRLPISFVTCALTLATCLYGAEEHPVTPEQVVLTIHESSNPALEPVKVAIENLARSINQVQEIRNKRGPDDAAAAPGRLNTPATPTPANSPTKLRNWRRIHRPAPVCTNINVGPGNLNLYDFAEITPPNQPVENKINTLEEETRKIEQSIQRLDMISKELLGNQKNLTEEEQKALNFINANSQRVQRADPRIVAAAAIGGIASSLVWAARINPLQVYKDCCSDNKFTGLEAPALLTALKALIGPVVALIGIGVLWYNFKKLVADPYRQETEKIQKEFVAHKRQMNEAITGAQLQQLQSEKQLKKIHTELEQTHEALHKAIIEQLARSESVNRQQLEYTLKTIAEREEELKKQITAFTTTARADLATLSNNVHDLQQSRDEIRTKTEQALTQQQNILQFVAQVKKNNEELVKTLKTKQLISSPRVVPLPSPQSAPVGGKGSGSLAAPPPSPHVPRSPQSAQELGTQKPKRSLLSKIRGKSSAQVSPLSLVSEAESKRTAAGNSPAAGLVLAVNT